MFGKVMQKRKYSIGLDAGPDAVRLLQVIRGSDGFEVRGAVDAPLEGGRYKDGLEWARAVTDTLASRVDLSVFSGRRCAVGIADDWIRARSLRQPKMPASEVDRAIALDAPSRLGFAAGEACEFGWVRAGEVRQGQETRDEIIVAGAPATMLETLVYGIAAVGLKPIAVEPGFLASARAMSRKHRRAGDQGDVRVIVDVGQYSTGVMVLRGDTVAFYKPIEIGGKMMRDAAAHRLGQEPEAVETLRQRRMRGDAGEVDKRVDRALYESARSILGDLATEVGRCARYYGVTFRGTRVGQCQVIGTQAREPELCRFIQESVNVPTEVGDPLGLEGDSRWSSVVRHGSGWASALGLSLRSGESRGRGGVDVDDREADESGVMRGAA